MLRQGDFQAFRAGMHFGGDGQTGGVIGGAVDALAGRQAGLVNRQLFVDVVQRIQGIHCADIASNTSYIYIQPFQTSMFE